MNSKIEKAFGALIKALQNEQDRELKALVSDEDYVCAIFNAIEAVQSARKCLIKETGITP